MTEADNFALKVVPDRALAVRLRHWKLHNNDIVIFISDAKRFTRAIATRQQRAALVSGKLPEVQRRISILVDHFDTSLDCDSAGFGAEFVEFAKSPAPAPLDLESNFGCG